MKLSNLYQAMQLANDKSGSTSASEACVLNHYTILALEMNMHSRALLPRRAKNADRKSAPAISTWYSLLSLLF